VRRLCALLGYSIRLDSVHGQGSAFSFDVPPGFAQARQPSVGGTAAGLRADLTGKLVVVVDDESAIVEGMRVLLTGWGAQVVGSTTGDDVVAEVHAVGRLPDLLIVDYRLGHSESGIELAQRLRQELDPEIPAILVTGSISAELAGRAQTAGLAFMLKPVIASALREQIGALLKVDLASDSVG